MIKIHVCWMGFVGVWDVSVGVYVCVCLRALAGIFARYVSIEPNTQNLIRLFYCLIPKQSAFSHCSPSPISTLFISFASMDAAFFLGQFFFLSLWCSLLTLHRMNYARIHWNLFANFFVRSSVWGMCNHCLFCLSCLVCLLGTSLCVWLCWCTFCVAAIGITES